VNMPTEWKTLNLLKMDLAPFCCACGKQTDTTKDFVSGTIWGLITRLIGYETILTVPFPYCEECRHAARRKAIKGVLIGLGVGILIVLIGAVVVGTILTREHYNAGIIVVGTAFVASPIIGWVISHERDPVRLRRYSSRKNTVQVRFMNSGTADRILQIGNVEKKV
jgi:amino acid transporter